jgi:hypothetical protein
MAEEEEVGEEEEEGEEWQYEALWRFSSETDCSSGFSLPSDPGFEKKQIVFVLCPLKHTNTH